MRSGVRMHPTYRTLVRHGPPFKPVIAEPVAAGGAKRKGAAHSEGQPGKKRSRKEAADGHPASSVAAVRPGAGEIDAAVPITLV